MIFFEVCGGGGGAQLAFDVSRRFCTATEARQQKSKSAENCLEINKRIGFLLSSPLPSGWQQRDVSASSLEGV